MNCLYEKDYEINYFIIKYAWVKAIPRNKLSNVVGWASRH